MVNWLHGCCVAFAFGISHQCVLCEDGCRGRVDDADDDDEDWVGFAVIRASDHRASRISFSRPLPPRGPPPRVNRPRLILLMRFRGFLAGSIFPSRKRTWRTKSPCTLVLQPYVAASTHSLTTIEPHHLQESKSELRKIFVSDTHVSKLEPNMGKDRVPWGQNHVTGWNGTSWLRPSSRGPWDFPTASVP